jgi:cytochrome c-type biogenesis protein CcmE
VANRRSPARLVIALSVAAALAVFLLYTSLVGGGVPSLQPGQLEGRDGKVSLAGKVVAIGGGNARAEGLRFTLGDLEGPTTVEVLYTGSVPDLFREERHVFLEGELREGVFVAEPGSLVTKCPSKYSPAAEAGQG